MGSAAALNYVDSRNDWSPALTGADAVASGVNLIQMRRSHRDHCPARCALTPIAAHHSVDDRRAMLSEIRPPPVEGLAQIFRCSSANRLSLFGGVRGSLEDSPASSLRKTGCPRSTCFDWRALALSGVGDA